jgi:hypothetical protein
MRTVILIITALIASVFATALFSRADDPGKGIVTAKNAP